MNNVSLLLNQILLLILSENEKYSKIELLGVFEDWLYSYFKNRTWSICVISLIHSIYFPLVWGSGATAASSKTALAFSTCGVRRDFLYLLVPPFALKIPAIHICVFKSICFYNCYVTNARRNQLAVTCRVFDIYGTVSGILFYSKS